jgi:hypothetical protein
MTIRTFATTSIALLATALPATGSLPAQEVVDLPGRDQRLDADFEDVFSIGVLDGEDWEMLATVTHVGFDENGNLYIVDQSGGMAVGGGAGVLGLGSSARVLIFDAAGNFLREFGTSGEGPGEFNMPGEFVVLRDGTTVVSDMGHNGYQLFDPNGVFLRRVRWSDLGGGPSGKLLVDPRGNAVFTGEFGGRITTMSFGGGPVKGPATSRPIARVGLGGEEVETDTVVEAYLPPRGGLGLKLPGGFAGPAEVEGALATALGSLSQPSVFEPPLLAGVLPDAGLVYSDSSAYELNVTRPDAGDVTRIVRRPFKPEPVTDRIEKEHRERQEAFREAAGGGFGGVFIQSRTSTTGGVASGEADQLFSLDMPEPTYYPELSVLRDLSTTWGGNIWVLRRGEAPESDGPIDVITSDGRYVGTFPTDATEIPDAFGPNGMAAFIELDEFDVARVVVRRLPTAVR